MKKLDLDLTKVPPTRLGLMDAFDKAARKAGWRPGAIDQVLVDFNVGETNRLATHLERYCEVRF